MNLCKKFKLLVALFICFAFCAFARVAIKAEQVDINIVDGASIRLSSPNGIRFTGTISSFGGVSEHGFYLALGEHQYDDIKEAIINNKSKVGENKLLKKQITGKSTEFYASVVNFEIDGLSNDITAICYYKDLEGNIFLSDNKVTRNILEISFVEEEISGDEYVTWVIDKYLEKNFIGVYDDVLNTYVIDNTRSEHRLKYLEEEFISDWNDFFGLELDSLGTDSSSDFYKSAYLKTSNNKMNLIEAPINLFFNIEEMNEKWGYLLDLIIEKTSDVWSRRQAIAVKNGGVYPADFTETESYYYGCHLVASIMGFFQNKNIDTGYQGIMWEKVNSYESFFDIDTGVKKKMIGTTFIKSDEEYTLPLFNKDGYSTNYYDENSNRISSGKITVQENRVLKLVYKLEEYSINYNVSNDVINTNPLVYSIGDNIVLQDPIKEGHRFLGWFKDSEFTNKVEEIEYGSFGDINLYPHFEEKTPYNITLILNGGTMYKDKNEVIDDFLVDFEIVTGFKANKKINENAAFGSNENHKVFWTNEEMHSKWSWLLSYLKDMAVKYGNNGIHQEQQSQYEKLINKEEIDVNDTYGYWALRRDLYAFVASFLNSWYTSSGKIDFSNEILYNEMYSYISSSKPSFVITRRDETELSEFVYYKNGYILEGWYENEECDGAKILKTEKTGTYYANWIEDNLLELEFALNKISNVVTSYTIDDIVEEISGNKIIYSFSNPNLYTIASGIGSTSRIRQTHKKQPLTVTASVILNGISYSKSKDIVIDPVLFDEMTNPKAVYVANGSLSHYTSNSQRYKETKEVFSDKFKENMDMVYYAFATVNEDGTLSLSKSNLGELMKLKNYGIRVLLVIDGATSPSLRPMVKLCNNKTTRDLFVNNIISMIVENNFDGVDIDWEFPGTSGLEGYTTQIDQVNLSYLLKGLREGLDDLQDEGGSNYLLTTAIPSSSWGANRYLWVSNGTVGGINDYCDYVNMMSYDLNNSSYSTHVAPCYSSNAAHDFKFGCVYGAQLFTSYGLDPKKVILGAANYGKAYKLTEAINESDAYPSLGKAATLVQIPGVESSYTSGTIFYTAIKKLMNTEGYEYFTEKNNGNIVASFLYNKTNDIFITFDSPEVVKAKCDYAKANGYGIMVWAYGEDATDDIIHTICDNLS